MSQAVKVGIFAFISLLILGYLILRIEDFRIFGGGGQRVDAVFDSVAGLDNKATVRVAGVRVGRVDGIGLSGDRARVTLLLEQPLKLTEGTRARIANMGLLGDKYVELVPGPTDAPPLPPGAVLPGETPVGLDQAMAKLNRIGESMEKITSSFVSEGTGASLNRLIVNLEATSAQIRDLVAANREVVSATTANIEKASATLATQLPLLAQQMERMLDQVNGILAENRGQLAGSMKNVEEVTGRLRTSVDNLNEITGKIASGEGTIGKLVNSDEAHDELVSTLGSIQSGVDTLSGTLGRIQRIRLDLGLEGYYLESQKDSLGAFHVDIDPDPGKGHRLYELGLVNTPQGREKTTTQKVTVTLPDGTSQTQTIETLTTRDQTSVTGLFGYRTGQGTRLWAGLIESNAGVKVDYPLLHDKLWLSFEAFNFDRPGNLHPHLRLSSRWWLHPNFYIVGGYDDFLESDRDSVFLGGGIRWNDDELKYLLGSVPKL